MHELSLAEEVIRIVTAEAEKHRLEAVGEIEIEVGVLSGVEAEAFEFSLGILAKRTILDDAVLKIVRTEGKGYCHACAQEFTMHSLTEACPECGFFTGEIRSGQDFRLISITPGIKNK